MHPDEWRERAQCKGAPARGINFYPDGKTKSRKRAKRAAPALALCWKCTVRARCAGSALDSGERHGIFGGVDLGDGFANLDEQREMLKLIAGRR